MYDGNGAHMVLLSLWMRTITLQRMCKVTSDFEHMLAKVRMILMSRIDFYRLLSLYVVYFVLLRVIKLFALVCELFDHVRVHKNDKMLKRQQE